MLKLFFLMAISFVITSKIYSREPASKHPNSDYSPTYQVKKGDTLSKIALEKFGGDIYARGGSLEQLLNLNPQIKKDQLIYPGQKLVLVDPALKLPKDLEVVVKNRGKN